MNSLVPDSTTWKIHTRDRDPISDLTFTQCVIIEVKSQRLIFLPIFPFLVEVKKKKKNSSFSKELKFFHFRYDENPPAREDRGEDRDKEQQMDRPRHVTVGRLSIIPMEKKCAPRRCNSRSVQATSVAR